MEHSYQNDPIDDSQQQPDQKHQQDQQKPEGTLDIFALATAKFLEQKSEGQH